MEVAGECRLSLPDILADGLDLVFVGINPSVYAAQRGHYFARPSNRFWPLLNASGLLPVSVRPEDDRRLPEFGIGLTDLVPWATVSASELSAADFAAGREALRAKLLRHAPRTVCFVGKIAYLAFSGRRHAAYGRQPEPLSATTLFVMPSTSGRANALQSERLRCLEAVRAFLGR